MADEFLEDFDLFTSDDVRTMWHNHLKMAEGYESVAIPRMKAFVADIEKRMV